MGLPPPVGDAVPPVNRGWYEDPEGTGQLRYWDGTAWARYWDGADQGRSPQLAGEVVSQAGRTVRGVAPWALAGFGLLVAVSLWGLASTLGPWRTVPDAWHPIAIVLRLGSFGLFLVQYLAWLRWRANVVRLVSPGDPAVDPKIPRRRRAPVAIRTLWVSMVQERWVTLAPVGLAAGAFVGSARNASSWWVPADRTDAGFVCGTDLLMALSGVLAAYAIARIVRILTPVVQDRVARGLSSAETPAV